MILQNANRMRNPFIKPMNSEDFWSRKSKMGSKIIEKALPREGFRNTFSQRRETL